MDRSSSDYFTVPDPGIWSCPETFRPESSIWEVRPPWMSPERTSVKIILRWARSPATGRGWSDRDHQRRPLYTGLGWGTSCDPASGSAVTPSRTPSPRPGWACRQPPRPPSRQPAQSRERERVETRLGQDDSPCRAAPPCAASRRPACSPQADGGTEPSFPPVHCAGILSSLQN